MKRKSMATIGFAEKFRIEKLNDKKMNYLVGGDADGSEPAPPDPWK